MKVFLVLACILLVTFGHNHTNAPVLVIHGVNSDCSQWHSDVVAETLDTYAHCYHIGGDPVFDSWFYNIRHQGEILCDRIHMDTELKHGNFSILAFSQGSVITKYILEYCPLDMPVRSVVTFGGPHMGVSYIPDMPRETWYGYILAILANYFLYFDFSQRIFGPADYWRDPTRPDNFLKYSRFLAEANNEKNFDQERKDKWLGLKHARFVKWEDDAVIIPRESSWWGMYDTDYNILSRFDTEVYQKDLVGIRTMEEEGRADFIAIPGGHMEVSHEKLAELVKPIFTL